MKTGNHVAFTGVTKLRNGILSCVRIALMASVYFMPLSMAAAEEIKQHKIVGDVKIVMSILHALDSPESGTESQTDHHLVIWLFKKGTSESIEGARVTADVGQTGFVGVRQMLKPVMADGKSAYSGVFPMPGRVAYNVKVQIVRPGDSRATEAVFEYSHHHKLR